MVNSCNSCGNQFEVSQEDLALLDKFAPVHKSKKYSIPSPVDCPDCRQIRRMSFRNEQKLYHRTCDITGKTIISIFSPDSPYKVCDKEVWYSDQFEAKEYGQNYDFDKPFFEQFKQLSLRVPFPSLRNELSENCDFNSDMGRCRNCYMCARTHESENIIYTYRGSKSNNCTDCLQISKCQYLYECIECVDCYDSKYLFFCSGCGNSAFLMDCRNCLDCFMCSNLRNKSHCFMNEQLSPEEYRKKMADFDFGSFAHVKRAYEMFEELKKKAIRRNLMIINAEGCTGDNLFNCKNCYSCFSVQESQDGRYLWDVKLFKDSMDAYSGGRNSELIYNTTAGANTYNAKWCARASDSEDITYSMFINTSQHIFGSIGLKRSKYCILNKQLTEDEYNDLVPKIIEHMQGTGEWGDFFPASCSPFAYNEIVAQQYFPKSKEAAVLLGYRWKDDDPRDYQPQDFSIPDNIKDVTDVICEQLLACSECGKNYRIAQPELKFYREHTSIVPRQCFDCRHMKRVHTRNPFVLRTDTCRKCGKEMDTTFPENTPMQIYCSECYREEVI